MKFASVNYEIRTFQGTPLLFVDYLKQVVDIIHQTMLDSVVPR